MCCGWLSWLAGVSLFKAPCRCTQAPCQQVRSHENHIPNPICPRSYKTSDSRNARKTFAKKKNTFAKSIAELSRGIMHGTKWSSPSYCKARTFRSTLRPVDPWLWATTLRTVANRMVEPLSPGPQKISLGPSALLATRALCCGVQRAFFSLACFVYFMCFVPLRACLLAC